MKNLYKALFKTTIIISMILVLCFIIIGIFSAFGKIAFKVNFFRLNLTLVLLHVSSLFLFIKEKAYLDKKVFVSFLIPFSLVICFCCLVSQGVSFVFLLSTVDFILCFLIALLGGNEMTTTVLSVISVFALIIFVLSPIGIFLMLTSGEDFVKVDVYKRINSPQNKYCAEVVISDYGAMGGNTSVQVKNYNEFDADLFFLKIEEKPKRVYLTQWDGWKNMEIYWKNENCLVIDGKEIYME